MNRLSHFVLKKLPISAPLQYFCKRYIDKCNSENNCDMLTNGELNLIKKILPACSTVVDVGANVGEWSALALSINSTAHIHCFEPSKITFQKLAQNNFPPNVRINNFGLSSQKGTLTLHIFEDNAGINSLYQRHGLEDGWNLKPQTKTEQVLLETLEHYCEQNNLAHIDFMKVDVEGHELEVFKGAKKLFEEQKVELIQFEYGGCNIDSKVFLQDIFNFFKNFDYSFYKIYPHALKHIARYDQRLENFQHQNWVLARNGSRLLNHIITM